MTTAADPRPSPATPARPPASVVVRLFASHNHIPGKYPPATSTGAPHHRTMVRVPSATAASTALLSAHADKCGRAATLIATPSPYQRRRFAPAPSAFWGALRGEKRHTPFRLGETVSLYSIAPLRPPRTLRPRNARSEPPNTTSLATPALARRPPPPLQIFPQPAVRRR